MNQEDKSPDESQAAADVTGVSDVADRDATAGSSDRPTNFGGWGVAFSLVVALLAAGGTGYLWWQQNARLDLNEQVADLRADSNARSEVLGRLTADVESLSSDAGRIDEQLGALSTRANAQFDELPTRIDQLEQTVDKIPGVARSARTSWLRAEAEYFLRIANAQVNLAGNVDVAIAALDLADEKLKALGDPAWTRVRAQISDDRAALNAMPRPDTEGIVLTLGSLAGTLDTLPLARQVPDQFGNRRSTDETENGFQRAWRVIVDALLSIITVRRDDEAVAPLMSESDESMLVRGLDIELQIARLAIVRGESRIYLSALEAVLDRLDRYFDPESPAVIAARETVNEMAQVELPETRPDISASLSLLLRVGNEVATP